MSGAGRPKKTRYQIPRGMHDLLPEDLKYFQKIFDTCDRIASYYRFGRIETPILEQAELFTKGVGQSTDIIEKQMYALKTEGGDLLALRPEYTASVARAFIEKGMEVLSKPVKLWYFGPCFRHEKPQAGRYREFWQFGFEALGERNPVIDAQIIRLFLNILEELKLKNLMVQINSIGDPKCRAHYKKVLTRFLKSSQAGLCSDCKKRLKQNPLRTLDCKNEKCQAIISQGPQVLDYLCKECRAHFKEVLEFLDALKIPYRLNPYLVRGLDYYTKTVFEISCGNPSSELNQPLLSLVGGGRYDGLVKLLGGKDTPACGAAAGIERIADLMKEKEIKLKEEDLPKVFLVQLGNLARSKALILFEEFRKAKIPVYEAFSKDSLRAQLARADRFGVKYVLILGQKEVLEKKVILRDMKNGNQRTFRMGEIVEAVKTELKNNIK